MTLLGEIKGASRPKMFLELVSGMDPLVKFEFEWIDNEQYY